MEKVWLNQYQEGLPSEINLNSYSSLVQLIETSFKEYASKPAFTCMGKTLSYAELDKKSKQLAAYLTEGLGLKKGERVAIMMPNLLQYPVALFAVLRAGLVAVNVNPLYTPRELEHQLKDSGAKAIFIVENFAHVLEEVIEKVNLNHVILTSLGEFLNFPKSQIVDFVVRKIKKMVPKFSLPKAISFTKALENGLQYEHKKVDLGHDDLAFLQYTGGTTGVSKGAMLSHGNMVANVEQASLWLSKTVNPGEEIIITALPLYHIFALTANCLTFMKIGGHNILITNPRDIPAFVKDLEKYPFTAITGVNTLFNALLHNPNFSKINFSPLKMTLGGGMAVQKKVAETWHKATGKPIIQAFGLTETSPAACINPMNTKGFNGSVGLPLPSTEVSIRGDDNQDLPIGEVGEICIRGPQVMKGYYNRKEQTEETLSSDGWLRTGDIGKLDTDGYVFIVDRKKDMILVSGFNVYPNEVEEIVVSHDKIIEAAAVGIPNERSGELVKVFAVKKDPSLTEQDLISYCRKFLTPYKVPKIVEFRDELPKTNVGKILRRALRDS